MRKPYMPVKVANDRIRLYMEKNVPRSSYRHLIKDECQICYITIPSTLIHYETYGNFCQNCNGECGKKKLTEKQLNEAFRNKETTPHNTYEDTSKEITEEMIKQVREELGLS